ncbi:hypothetical protein F503_07395 [Ophiostoma piceae UAMH 11346]|uniref:Duf28 domain-containing protein n=1 Tax=Ophiostoma piceae (strain UAMH 11346) TaxID=1262450 RepID=S3C7X4_OPHP1|nr:hypothetical protein F503_07395 [Ophiostoma piceae UAMH 11346]
MIQKITSFYKLQISPVPGTTRYIPTVPFEMPQVGAAAMRGLRPASLSFQGAQSALKSLVCAQCRRSLSSSAVAASGHNRWSKIRHEKGAADLKKTALRSNFTKTMTFLSQMYGADLSLNAQLAATVTNAKKCGVPKAVIEAAIARGQGRSASGANLEHTTFEIMMPPSIALVIDAETESKARATQDLNAMIKRKGGVVKSTKFFFARRGRVVFGEKEVDSENGEQAAPSQGEPVSADDILEDVIEAGADDVETDDEGNIVVWTPPHQTAAVVNAVTGGAAGQESKFKDRLTVLSSDNIWSVNEETRAPLGNRPDELRKLTEMIAALRAYQDVRAIYCNAVQGDAPDEIWQQLEQDIDW